MKIILSVFYLNFANIFRNFKSSGIMFILPIIFMGVFAMAFGGNNDSLKFDLGIYTNTESAIDYKALFEKISNDSEDLNIKVINIEDQDSIEKSLNNSDVDVVLSITSNNQENKTEVLVKQQSPYYIQLQAFVKEVMYTTQLSESQRIETTFVNKNVENASGFDLLAPGLIIYGLLILIPGIAIGFTSITEKNYIFRFANSKARAFHIIIGSVLYFMALSIVQLFLLYFTAKAFGFNTTGNVFVAIVPAVLAAFFVIGVGLLIGAFTKKTDSASNLGTIVSIILGFFSGSFITGIGNILEFNLFGRIFQFNDLLPSKWATDAINKVLTENKGLSDITFELLVLLISGLIFLILGAYVYQRKQLNVQD